MRYTPFSETKKFENSTTCTVYEYGGNKILDGAAAEINGRYPETGWVTNTISTEIIYVVEGKEILTTRERRIELTQAAVVLVERGEQYYFEGENLRIFMATTPPWSPDQYVVEQ